MNTLEFARPGVLSLLLLLPVWGLLVWPWPDGVLFFARGEAARPHAGRWGVRAATILLIPRLLRALGLASLVLALAEPQRVETVTERTLRGQALALAVDLSTSMLANDMEGGRTRIDVAREAAVRFASNRSLDEMSLVAFAGGALTRVPPTIDPRVLVAGVESLEIQLVGDGTDISAAVLTAVARLLESEREPRVVILLTDGAHNGTGVRPLAAARAAASVGVKVHAISVLPPEDPARVAARRGSVALPDARAEMRTVLGGIAEITGGRYFHAATSAALDSIYGEIDRLERPTEVVTDREIRHPLRVWFLVGALLVLAADVLVRGTRWGVIP